MKEIAEVVTQEKLLLEECLELFKTISALEVRFLQPKICIMGYMIVFLFLVLCLTDSREEFEV